MAGGMMGAMYPGPQGIGDVLSIIGASLKDASPGSSGENLMQARQMMAQRAFQQYQMGLMGKLPGLFGGQAQYQEPPAATVGGQLPTQAVAGPSGAAPADIGDLSGALAHEVAQSAPAPAPDAPPAYTGQLPQRVPGTGPRIPSINDPQLQSTLASLSIMNPELAKNLRENIVAAQPHVIIAPDGTAIDDKSSANVGKVFPGLDKGILATRDASGNVIGSNAIPGYADAVAGIAGATTGAQEQAKAPWTLVDVPQSDGSTIKLPLAIAAPMLAARAGAQAGPAPAAPAGGIPQVNGGAPAPGPAPQLGTSQTPAQKAFDEERAKGLATRGLDQPKATATLSDADRTADFARNTIHDILGETLDPKTNKWVKTKPSQVNFFTTGMLGAMEHVPGSPAHDLQNKLDTIRGQTAISELQKMRDESPTGGALGRVTQQEIDLLAAMRGSLEQTQSGKQLEQSLRHHLGQLDALAQIRDRQYAQMYPNGQPAPTQAPAAGPVLKAPNYTITAIRRGGQ